MALGGGIWMFQNKVLPGAYINFESKDRPIVNFADRGYAALPIELDWGVEGDIFTVDAADFQKETTAIFGYDYTHEKMKPLRDLFMNLKTGHFYRLNSGAMKAANEIGTAKYGGVRGNDLKIVVAENLDEENHYDVTTYLEASIVDRQTVQTMAEVEDNSFITFKKDWEIAPTAGMPLEGGSNGTAPTGLDYQTFLDLAERKYFNVLICPSTESTIKSLFMAYTRRLRDDVGIKFQLVAHHVEQADYEGIISVYNKVKDQGASEASLVYWTGGAEASCAINASLTNKVYDGEYTVDVNFKQSEITKQKQLGQLVFHEVGTRIDGEYVQKVRLLEDINTFTSFTPQKNDDFSNNQVIRVLDQIAIDIATLFNEAFLGKVPNDAEGRASFKSNVVYHHKELERVRAIQNFNPDDVIVEKGLKKGAVVVTDPVEPTGVMDRLYMKVIVA